MSAFCYRSQLLCLLLWLTEMANASDLQTEYDQMESWSTPLRAIKSESRWKYEDSKMASAAHQMVTSATSVEALEDRNVARSLAKSIVVSHHQEERCVDNKCEQPATRTHTLQLSPLCCVEQCMLCNANFGASSQPRLEK